MWCVQIWELSGHSLLGKIQCEWFGTRESRVNEDINYYGHASAVASLCSHASALVSNTKYACEMKPRGLSFPFSNSSPYQET